MERKRTQIGVDRDAMEGERTQIGVDRDAMERKRKQLGVDTVCCGHYAGGLSTAQAPVTLGVVTVPLVCLLDALT